MTGSNFNGPRAAAAEARLAARLARLRRLAILLDAAIVLPGGIRIGADGIIGLVPVVGDAAMTLVGAIIVVEAARLGLPRHKIWRMIVNLGVDGVFGSVPLVGDLFDIAFKVNLRNLRIIEDHFARRQQ